MEINKEDGRRQGNIQRMLEWNPEREREREVYFVHLGSDISCMFL